ncbi:MAG: VOC family protein, partial [Verrucomicrobiaceae bacterium]
MGNEFASDEKTASTGLMPRRLGHVNLFVSDLERSMAFYENVAGFHEIFREPDIQAGFLSNGNTHHDFGLIQTSAVDRVDKTGKVLIAASQRGREPGLNHLGFEMSNQRELVLAYQKLKQAGANVGRTVDH